MEEKTTTSVNVIDYIKDNYPTTEREFQVLLNEMYKTFFKKRRRNQYGVTRYYSKA